MSETLFPIVESEAKIEPAPVKGEPRLLVPNRAQIELRPVDLESLVPMDHPVRAVWEFVESLDLSPLYGKVQAVEGGAGRPAIDPRIYLALWLYATIEGVGSARALERLTRQHDAYRWILGGVSVNHHSLSDFRVQHAEYLDGVLTHSVAVLMAQDLVQLNRVTQGIRTPVYAKAEFFNPGGSVKDRIGLAMIEAAEREGRLKPGGLVVEATSGNTGVGLALAAAVKGYRCIFTMPDKMSQEKARLLRALGAEVIITPTAVPPDHPDNYIMKGRAIAAAHPNAIFADQHYNPVNPDVHYRTTGPEIWEQTAGRITHFVCAPGTGGTVSGAGRFLKEQRPTIRVIGGDPVGSIYSDYARTRRKSEGSPYKVEGIGGDKIPTSLHWDVIDEWITVSDKDAMLLVRRLAKEEGLFAGGSTGVNVVAALEVARRVNDPEALVVTVLADTGERYLSKVFNDEWLRENQILDAERVSVAQLLEARNSGAPPLISVPPTATVRQALNLMSTYNVSQLPVLDGGDGVGAVAEPVLMARALEEPVTLDRPVQEVMDAPFPVVDADLPVERLTTLLSRETPAALVRREGKIAGIVTRYDVLHQLAGIR